MIREECLTVDLQIPFFRVDIPLCHYFKKEIKDLTIGIMDHNKGSDDGV